MALEITRIKCMVANAYLITGDVVAMVDTGPPTCYKKIMNALSERGINEKDIELILITHHHFDHVGNLKRLKEASGAVIIAGAADAPVIEGTAKASLVGDLNRLGRFLQKLPESWLKSYQKYDHVAVDRTVSGGEVIEGLGLEVIALPGHTAGGVGFVDRKGNRAFIGDIVSCYRGKPGMPTISASESLGQIFDSQEKLAGLELDVAYPGHGAIIASQASKIISDMTLKKRARLL